MREWTNEWMEEKYRHPGMGMLSQVSGCREGEYKGGLTNLGRR